MQASKSLNFLILSLAYWASSITSRRAWLFLFFCNNFISSLRSSISLMSEHFILRCTYSVDSFVSTNKVPWQTPRDREPLPNICWRMELFFTSARMNTMASFANLVSVPTPSSASRTSNPLCQVLISCRFLQSPPKATLSGLTCWMNSLTRSSWHLSLMMINGVFDFT